MLSLLPVSGVGMTSNDAVIYLISGVLFAAGAAMIMSSVI
jgi:hypothetical protein